MIYNITRLLLHKYYDVLQKEEPLIRQTMIFEYFTAEVPLKICENDYIGGWYGYEDGTVEFQADTPDFPYTQVLSSVQSKLRSCLGRYHTVINFTNAHTCIDYGTVLEKGLVHYLDMVEQELLTEPENKWLQAMKRSILAACGYAERFAALAKDRMEEETNTELKKRYENMYIALSRVPYKPARNFLEAVQCVWLMHTLVPISESSWASISLGRTDQYLYPYYQKHIQAGGTVAEIKAILKNLFTLLDSYGDGACAMNIGGADAKGKCMINELSEILIEVEKEMSLRSPILVVRVTSDMPEKIWDRVIDFDLFKIGQPTFYGEMNCRKSVQDRGIAQEEAAGFSVNSCMGLVVAGKEFADMWGIKLNSHLALELAANDGVPFIEEFATIFDAEQCKVEAFEELLQRFSKYLKDLISVSADIYEAAALETAVNFPNPFLSVLTEGCLQKRQDRSVGAKYNTVTVETMGLVNTFDALIAIKELVFDKKQYTLQEFVQAAKADYQGYEDLRRDILKCKKYGMNDAGANALCKRICDMVYCACKAKNHNNRYFLPSLHTIDANVGYGKGLGATMDGRRKGEPVNKNANPSQLLKKNDCTSVVLSATALEQYKFSGGQPIDLYFDKSWFNTDVSRNKIKSLILTYFTQGGLQLQVNSMDLELLEKAHQNPQEYPHVIIRKGGYSVWFAELSESAREDFLAVARKLEQHA